MHGWLWEGKRQGGFGRVALLTIGAAAVGVLASAPAASADPDPHVPNGDAGWCPGGERPGGGGVRYCLGAPFPSGAMYVQTWSFGSAGPFKPGSWLPGVRCMAWVEGSLQGGLPYGGSPDCGGGPATLP